MTFIPLQWQETQRNLWSNQSLSRILKLTNTNVNHRITTVNRPSPADTHLGELLRKLLLGLSKGRECASSNSQNSPQPACLSR